MTDFDYLTPEETRKIGELISYVNFLKGIEEDARTRRQQIQVKIGEITLNAYIRTHLKEA